MPQVVFRHSGLPPDEERRTDDFDRRKGDEGDGRPSQHGHRQKTTDAADEDHAPKHAKQDGLLLDGGDQPVEGKAEAEPDAGIESKVGVQEDDGRHASRNVDRIVDAQQAERDRSLPGSFPPAP